MDDSLQESYLKAFRALPRFEGDSAFKSWLYRIVHNTCLDELRRKVGVLPLESVSERPDGRPDPGDVATDKLDLVAAVGSLSPDTRAAVLLVYVNGMDYRTASEVLGVLRGTLASRLHRGRARLQRALDGSEGEDGIASMTEDRRTPTHDPLPVPKPLQQANNP